MKKTLQTKKNDSNEVSRILLIEELFFSSPDHEINYEKIDINSKEYDFEYERRLRSPQMNKIFLLNEIILQIDPNQQSCLLFANNMEEKLLESFFYRDLLLGNIYNPFVQDLSEFIITLTHNINFIRSNMNENSLQNVQKEFVSIPPCTTKNEFINELQEILMKARHIYSVITQ